jgi:hypothetical protein
MKCLRTRRRRKVSAMQPSRAMTSRRRMSNIEAPSQVPPQQQAAKAKVAFGHPESLPMPVNADVGALDVMFLNEADPHGSPLGSKGVGELGIFGAGAAVINAIHNATGARIRDMPATPVKLLARLEALDA